VTSRSCRYECEALKPTATADGAPDTPDTVNVTSLKVVELFWQTGVVTSESGIAPSVAALAGTVTGAPVQGVAVGVAVGVPVTVAVGVAVGVPVPPADVPTTVNGKSCRKSGAAAGLPVSTASAHAPVDTVCCLPLSVASPREPAIVLEGWNTVPPAATEAMSQSNQYPPAGSVVFIVTVFDQILRVVPGAVPGGGATVLNIRNRPESVDDASLLVVVSPNTTVAPASPGRPFQIRSVIPENGDGEAAEPVWYA